MCGSRPETSLVDEGHEEPRAAIEENHGNQRGSSCESPWGGPGTGISFPPYYKPTKDMGSASAFYPTSEELDRKEMRVTLVARGGRGAAQPRAGAARARQHGRRPRPGVPGARIGAPGPWRPAGRSRAGGWARELIEECTDPGMLPVLLEETERALGSGPRGRVEAAAPLTERELAVLFRLARRQEVIDGGVDLLRAGCPAGQGSRHDRCPGSEDSGSWTGAADARGPMGYSHASAGGAPAEV